MKYEFVYSNRSEFPVKKMCQVLKVSKSGCYNWENKGLSNRSKENTIMLNRIKAIYDENRGRDGSIRITKQLKKDGNICGKNRIARLMFKNDIRAKTKKRFKVTTNSKHNYLVSPNLLKQDFTVKLINKKWVCDITYIYTSEGWLYFAGILDLCSKKIVGWAFGNSLTGDLVIRALQQAITQRDIQDDLTIHSDRGVQYSCHEYRKLIAKNINVPSNPLRLYVFTFFHVSVSDP